MVVVGRRPDPLVVPLKDATGKQFSAGSTRITIHKTDAHYGGRPTVDFTLETGQTGPEQSIASYTVDGKRFAANPPLDLMEIRLELVDGRGEPVYWQFSRPPTERTQGRMAIIIPSVNAQETRLENLRLRYWNVIAAATDVPFTFKDVPTP
jgi:hypothetical protein